MPETLGPEDLKLVTLARTSRSRGSAHEGAAVRDTTGRTYAATSVALASLHLSALQAAVAAAVSSGAEGLEAAAVVTDDDEPDVNGMAAVRDLGGLGTPVFIADRAGEVRGTARA
jgi:hypothetical protein